MGVASPFQSSKPLEYWLSGLKTAELVQLWDFLSRNLDDVRYYDYSGSIVENLPTSEVVKKHLYSESLPSSFLCLKTKATSRGSEREISRSTSFGL